MNTSKHCSFRTFWLGYCDWFKERANMSHSEALAEARAELKQRPPLLPLIFIATVMLALVLLAAVTPAIVRASSDAGMSSRDVAIISQWGTVALVAIVVGAFVVSRARRIHRFCSEMCERGQALEAARADKPF